MSGGKFASYFRPAAIGGVILYLMIATGMFSGPPSKIALNLFIWLTFAGILLIPQSWWNPQNTWATLGLLAAETAANLLFYREPELVYFIVFVVFYTRLRLSLSKPFGLALWALLITALLFIRFGEPNLTSIIIYLTLAFVIYSVIRRRLLQKEMNEQNRRHLAELQAAYDQLQEASVASMRSAVLEERTRIARDIHDSVGHSLTSLIVQLQALRYMIKQDPGQAEQTVDAMLTVARQGLKDIRSSVHELADDRAISGKAALSALLTRMEASAGLRYVLRDELPDGELGDGVFGTLFKVLQEGITNTVRHAQATEMEVDLRRESGSVVMSIRDNGKLSSGQTFTEGFGLKAMRARLEKGGGSLRYAAREPHGFEIVAVIPEERGFRRQESREQEGPS